MKEIVEQLWKALQNRNWDTTYNFLHEKFVLILPQSGERYGRNEYITLNRDYPGDWELDILEIHELKESIMSVVKVTNGSKVDWGISFFTFEDNRILSLREYWAEAFPIPEWRKSIESPIE